MDRTFTQELMEKTGFPAEARQAFTQAEEQLLLRLIFVLTAKT